MSIVDLTGASEFEAGLGDLLNLFGVESGMSTDEALKRLTQEADSLAAFTIKCIVALFWWAAHISSATADAFGYAAQIQAEAADTDKYNLETWRQFLLIQHPAEIRRVYIRTTKRIQVVKREMVKQHRVDLGPIKRELAALERWKNKTADPTLKDWRSFHATWDKTYLPPLRTLTRWLHSPKTFAAYATPPLLAYLPSVVGNKRYRRSLTAIEAGLVATWVNDPQPIFDSMLKWLVTT